MKIAVHERVCEEALVVVEGDTCASCDGDSKDRRIEGQRAVGGGR